MTGSPAKIIRMRINRAVGLGIALLVLQWLASGIWMSIEDTIQAAAQFSQAALGAAETGVVFTTPATNL